MSCIRIWRDLLFLCQFFRALLLFLWALFSRIFYGISIVFDVWQWTKHWIFLCNFIFRSYPYERTIGFRFCWILYYWKRRKTLSIHLFGTHQCAMVICCYVCCDFSMLAFVKSLCALVKPHQIIHNYFHLYVILWSHSMRDHQSMTFYKAMNAKCNAPIFAGWFESWKYSILTLK